MSCVLPLKPITKYCCGQWGKHLPDSLSAPSPTGVSELITSYRLSYASLSHNVCYSV